MANNDNTKLNDAPADPPAVEPLRSNADKLAACWRENECGDESCETFRYIMARMVIEGGKGDHRFFAKRAAHAKGGGDAAR